MTAVKSNPRVVALSLAAVAACGAALFLFVTYLLPILQSDATTAHETIAHETPAPALAVAPAPSPAAQEIDTALATAQSYAIAPLSNLAARPSGPAIDVARIEETGEAVIAGSAAPGATVELLRDGQPFDQAVADPIGQFAIVSQLPPGKYELTLRAKAPDGTITVSRSGVPVALNETASGAAQVRADAAPAGTQEAAAAPRSELRAAAPRSEVRSAAAPASEAAASATVDTATGAIAGKPSTRVVSRGDSLWRISRLAYGDGTRYALIYKANRSVIHDPNRIYPGQTFQLPSRPQ